MNINQAVKKHISRLRLPEWNSKAYIELNITKEGYMTSWVKLFDVGLEEPIILLFIDIDDENYEEYKEETICYQKNI